MSDRHPSKSGLDPAFIETQRQRLQAMLDALIVSGDGAGGDQAQAQYAAVDEVRDSGDDGETSQIGANDEATLQHAIRRMADIRHALEKIDAGTYGLSDISGAPIGKERLLAVPEAATAIGE